ncbi:MAG: hypothetical protein ACTJF0_11880 [Psychroflexus halocasei]
MAWYSDRDNVKESSKTDKFTKNWSIGETPKFPGIYKCQHCGFEDVMNRDCDKLPPCSNCKAKGHSNTWKLLVRADNE